jgi:transposase
MKIQVLRYIRKKYACPCCEQNVKTAALPPQPIPISPTSPGLLAHITASKIRRHLGVVSASQYP